MVRGTFGEREHVPLDLGLHGTSDRSLATAHGGGAVMAGGDAQQRRGGGPVLLHVVDADGMGHSQIWLRWPACGKIPFLNLLSSSIQPLSTQIPALFHCCHLMDPYKKLSEPAVVEDPAIALARKINLATQQNCRLKAKAKAAPLKKQKGGGGGGGGCGG